MDFYEVVDRVVTLLQQRGRLTYRSLRRQFDLDDEALEDLKDELLFSHPVVDEDGRGLVWTGEAGAPAEPTSTSTRPAQPDVTQEASPPKPSTPDAERRQLTVMFCDLVGSTPLSEQLDPEDLREVVRAYQQTCAEVVQRFEGHIAQLLGDALLVYFGWPQAHEDDAQRAVRTGLGMLEAMGTLNVRLEQDKGIRLAIRVGIHTGLVVVGKMGGGGHQERLALGEVPNIASRLQGLAEPDTVVISEATYRLVQGYFDCDDLGSHTLKGIAEPVQVYRVLRESGAQSRLEIASARGLTPLVGREQEVGLLLERWAQVKDGQGQIVLLSGEGGIGKSRLVQVLKEHVAEQRHTRWECRSSPYYQNTALYPITDLFQRTLQWQPEDSPNEKLAKLERTLSQYRLLLEECVPLFAPLVSLSIPEDRYPPLAWSPQRQRQKTLEAIVAILLEQAEQQPVLFIMEDLHWTDPSTLELLDLLIDQTPTASIFTMLTCRPEFQPTWSSRSYLTQVTLNRLSRSQIEHMAERVAGGKKLPGEVLQQIVEKTDGVPLFVEEFTKAVLESEVVKEVNGQYELTGSLTSLTTPATLQDSLMARLDRLVTAKAVAQYAAVIGRHFSYALLQAVSQVDEPTLQRELRRLVEAELLYQRGLPPQAIYTFKHALIQDAAYQSLLKSTRHQYHQRIANVLETQFLETAETHPELLAYHYTEAGLKEQAIGYWQRAGKQALQRLAYVEAIHHLTTALELLAMLPDTPERIRHELDLRIALGPPLIATKGYTVPEVGHTYARARDLCRHTGETPQLFQVLRGLGLFYFARAELQAARELGERLIPLAQRQHDPALLLIAHVLLGQTLLHLGEFALARTHLEQGKAFDPEQQRVLAVRYGVAPGVQCLIYTAQALWFPGYPAQALRKGHEAMVLARSLSHPHSLALAQFQMARLYLLRREVHAARELAEATITLSAEQGFPLWLAVATFFRGQALVVLQDQAEEGLAQMQRGMTGVLTQEAEIFRLSFLIWLGEAYAKMGQVEEGLRMLEEALVGVDESGRRIYEAELHRLKGELLLQLSSDNQTEAETCFHKALEVARNQQAKSLELRASTSLSRLWQQQGKRKEAYDLLAPVYNWFTEGFDTADLKDAKVLLEELA